MQFFKESIYRQANGTFKLAFDELIRKTKLILEDMTLTNFAQVYENNKSRIELASENLILLCTAFGKFKLWISRTTIFNNHHESMWQMLSTIRSKCKNDRDS
jgi:hypothetical protein